MNVAGPSNRAIASLLNRHAQLLQVAGESSFRARAYSKAAEAISATPELVTELLREGRLRDIPGIGAGIAAAIESVVDSGTFPEHDELTASFPESLLELLSLSGVGFKTARLLFEQHDIDGVDALEESIESGAFEQLVGISARTKATLVTSLEELRERSGQIPLGFARLIAGELAQSFERLLPGARIELTGALRRWEVTVTEIELAIAAEPS